ncbi:MAG: hypothetical protein IV086_11640 [Hyphomonadaceae bacterium]|nr:MAG: hypothetical protein FD160_2572 [Caulobacteraceae bacterium]MBT9446343.1 hypothetical protein [Hyphomonadaceae bacterium]TPW01740.1 MAG: hypothetical protein FD124_3628 [Alphaproteobacteria bacterium]
MRHVRLIVLSAAIALGVMAGPAVSQQREPLDFSTAPDETGDVFAASVEARYAAPTSAAAAVADLRAQGMTCTSAATATCTKQVNANGCTYTFVAKVGGGADRAVVTGVTMSNC